MAAGVCDSGPAFVAGVCDPGSGSPGLTEAGYRRWEILRAPVVKDPGQGRDRPGQQVCTESRVVVVTPDWSTPLIGAIANAMMALGSYAIAGHGARATAAGCRECWRLA